MCVCIYIYIYIYTCIYIMQRPLQSMDQGRAVQSHAEGAAPPGRQTYMSVMFGFPSQSRS